VADSEAGTRLDVWLHERLSSLSRTRIKALVEASLAAGEWQRDIVKAVFGSLDAENRRQVPEVFALVPKKNSKTTGGAAMMVTDRYVKISRVV
jgi:phage terminase large subunit-like protein